MITASTSSSFGVHAVGEGAEVIAHAFSPGTVGDIEAVVMASRDYESDIDAVHRLDETLEAIRDGFSIELTCSEKFNPLYVPCTIEELDEVLESDSKAEQVLFSGMNGNPFILKSTELVSEDQVVVRGHVSYKVFDIPSYETIMANQKSFKAC